MPWNCRLIEWTPEVTSRTLNVGDMFYWKDVKDEDGYDDWPMLFGREEVLSEAYKASGRKRLPLLVFFPSRTIFCVDGACWRGSADGTKTEYYGGWTVTGEAPLITVSPSVNMVGIYHGFLQNGVITDDCEGRKFEQDGRRMIIPEVPK